MPKTYTFLAGQITCPSCADTITRNVQGNIQLENGDVIQIQETNVAVLEKQILVTVNSEADEQLIVEQLKKMIEEEAFFDCEFISETQLSLQPSEDTTNTTVYAHAFKGALGLLFGATLLILSMLGVVMPIIPLFLVSVFSVGLVLYLGIDSYFEAFEKLFKAKALTMDTLFTVASLVALGISMVALFIPGLPNLFGAALLIFGFRHIGKAIEESAKKAVVSRISFRDRARGEVGVIEIDQSIRQCKLSDIKPGDVINVLSGEAVPLDGVCLNDVSVLKTIMTGSPLPEKVTSGEALLAGMRVTGTGSLKLRVTATEANSYLARMDKKISEAEQSKAPIETQANKLLHYFIPLVFILAIISGICVGCFCTIPLAIQCVVAVLVSACPCTLGLIVPLAIKIGLAKAARCGAQFTGGESLQKAANIDTVVFDLNGTLTTGTPSVQAILYEENETADILPYLIALEKASLDKTSSSPLHPFAKAICQKFPASVSSLKSLVVSQLKTDHCGRRATIKGHIYTVGNRTMMKNHGIGLPSKAAVQSGRHQVFFARGDTVIACITLEDPLRSNAKAVVAELQQRGKMLHICTGADEETARYYARELGISADNVKANCGNSEDSKLAYIRKLQAEGKKVAMVGDAGNDALAVAGSDLGIAIKSATSDSVTQDKAGVVIEKGALESIPFVFSIAEDAIKNIQQNLVISLTYNMVILILASGLLLSLHCAMNPGIGVALMILQMCFVLANAYRFNSSGSEVDPKSAAALEGCQSDEGPPFSLSPRLENVRHGNEDFPFKELPEATLPSSRMQSKTYTS